MTRREQLAALLAILLGAPLVFLFARAVADGQRRSEEAPVRAILGDESFDALAAGERTAMHYMGNDRSVPDFTLTDRNGQPWRMSDHEGKLVVLNFWSITCRPCIQEMPTLEELAQMSEDWPDVEIVAVSTDSGWDEVSSILPEEPALTHLFDPDREVVGGKFGTRLFPETWIIDPDGIIRFRYDGPLDWSSPLTIDLIRRFR